MFLTAYEAHKRRVRQREREEAESVRKQVERVRKEERARIEEALDRMRSEHGASGELPWDDILNIVRQSPEK